MHNRSAVTLLFAANIISGFAQGITMIAIPWYFINMLGKASLFGAIYGSVTFATLFWSLYTGTLIDKYNRRNLFIYASVAGGILLLGSSATSYCFGRVPEFFAGLVFAATFLIYSLHFPNLYAFAHEITEPENYDKITSYIEIQGQVTNMIAGALATVLLAGEVGDKVNFAGIIIHLPFHIRQWELHEIFLMDGITYCIAVFIISKIKFKPVAKRKAEEGNVWVRLISGINYLKQFPLIFIFGVASSTVFVTIMIMGYQLVPIYIDKWLGRGADVYAASEVFFAAGAVLAGVMIARIFKNRSRIFAILLLSVAAAGTFFASFFHTNPLLFYFFYFLLGLCNAGVRIMRVTHLFHLIPNQVFGRTGGVFVVSNLLLRLLFIGLFSIPFFAVDKNVIYACSILGLFILLSMIPLLIRYRELNVET